MCTTAAIYLDGFFLIKTRDPVRGKQFEDDIELFENGFQKLIILNDDGMYGGINEGGVGMVATSAKSEENQISYFERNHVRKILDAPSSRKAVDIVRRFDPLIAGNILIADSNQCFSLECGFDRVDVKEVSDRTVKTNHFHRLPYQPINYGDSFINKWTGTRYERACLLLEDITEWEGLKRLLSDHEGFPDLSICNHGIIQTASAFIIDTKNRKMLYCKGKPCENQFEEYRIST